MRLEVADGEQPSAYKAGGPSKRPSRGRSRRDCRRAAHPPASGDCVPAATKLARPGRLAPQQDGHDAKKNSCTTALRAAAREQRSGRALVRIHPPSFAPPLLGTPSPSTAVAARRAASQRRGAARRWRGGEAFDAVCMGRGCRPWRRRTVSSVTRGVLTQDSNHDTARGGGLLTRTCARLRSDGGCDRRSRWSRLLSSVTTYTKLEHQRGMWQRSRDLPSRRRQGGG